MADNAILNNAVSIETEITSGSFCIEDETVIQYGIIVKEMFINSEICVCRIDGISTDREFVYALAKKIKIQRITPQRVYDFIENELSS